MTQTSYPFDNLDTTETQYSQLFRRLQYTGVSGTPTSSDLRPLADSSGMTVKVPAGFAIVRGHAYSSDAEETLTISAAAAQARRDLVVLRLDPSANSITLAVKAGTPASSPSDPALTQTLEDVFELPLARVDVPANAVTITASNVTDLRRFIGQQFGLWTSARRPESPTVGTAGFNTSVGRSEYWDGSQWRQFQFEGGAITAGQLSASEQLLLNVGRVNGSRFTVSATAPASPAVGDIWFW